MRLDFSIAASAVMNKTRCRSIYLPIRELNQNKLTVAALGFVPNGLAHPQEQLVGAVESLEVGLRGVPLVRRVLIRVRAQRSFAVRHVHRAVPRLLLHRQVVEHEVQPGSLGFEVPHLRGFGAASLDGGGRVGG